MDILRAIIETFVVIGALGTIISTLLYILTAILFNLFQRISVGESKGRILQKVHAFTTLEVQKGASMFILLSILFFIALFLIGLLIILVINR